MDRDYHELREMRGTDRARIAVIQASVPEAMFLTLNLLAPVTDIPTSIYP